MISNTKERFGQACRNAEVEGDDGFLRIFFKYELKLLADRIETLSFKHDIYDVASMVRDAMKDFD